MDIQLWDQPAGLIQELGLTWWKILVVIGVGVIAGFINTLAGSGSLLTLPLLMFLGLPANVANGTNRIAILLQNVVGVASFKRQKVLDLKAGIDHRPSRSSGIPYRSQDCCQHQRCPYGKGHRRIAYPHVLPDHSQTRPLAQQP